MNNVTDEPVSLADMRRRYTTQRLRKADTAANPFDQFRRWMRDAVAAGHPEPNAMVVATADADGDPSARHVLLKELDDTGFVFFTNLRSRKATELTTNPRASLCFPWFAMERQVVVCGAVEGIGRDEVRAYWQTRPRESQVGAWASAQSTVVASREELEAAARDVANKYPDDIPLPDFWGGFRVVPGTIEFWQGGPGRLHDRLQYRRDNDGWQLFRLAP